MKWYHISEIAPELNEKVIFIHGAIDKDNICYGRIGDEYWIDFSEPDENNAYIPLQEVEWWCRITLPKNIMTQ